MISDKKCVNSVNTFILSINNNLGIQTILCAKTQELIDMNFTD